MDDFLRDLALVALGAMLTLIVSIGLKFIERALDRRDRRQRRERLQAMLYEEVEQIAEMLDIDLHPKKITISGGPLAGSVLTDLSAPLERLRDVSRTKVLFEAYSGQLIWLQGYLPNAVVRFYVRLPGYVERLEEAAESGDEEKWEAVRTTAYHHAEALKSELSQS